MVHSLLGNETTENKENDFSEKKKKKKEIWWDFLLASNYKKKSKGQKSETKPWPSFANDVCPWWNSIGKINVVINIHIILYQEK